MQVNRVNNQQPTFGMRYVKPRKWDPEILKTLMDSELVKEIDAKYPKAKAIYEHTVFGFADPLNNISLTIQLAKNKSMCLFQRFAINKNYYNYETDCKAKIKETTLANIEKACKYEQIQAQMIQDIENKNKQTFARAYTENAKNFICKLFGIE